MSDTDLPLFSWKPPACQVITFPMINRVGKIRDTAANLIGKQTERQAEHYRNQVTRGLERQFEKIGLSQHQCNEHIRVFWMAVEHEIIRLGYRKNPGNNPTGAA